MLEYWGTGLRPIPQTPTPVQDEQNYSRARTYRGHARTISNIVGEKLSKCAVSFSNSKQGDGTTRRVVQIINDVCHAIVAFGVVVSTRHLATIIIVDLLP